MKYIDTEKLIAEIERRRLSNRYVTTEGYEEELREIITSLQQEQPAVQSGKIVFPKYLYARTKDNKTIDMSYAPQDMTAVEYIRNDFIEQDQPEVDLDFQVFAKEMDAVFNLPKEVTENTEENPLNWEYAIARQFYALGLNTRKQ